MNTLFFTHQHRRSTKTLRLHYGLEGMKYIIQVYEGEINGHGEKVGLTIEYQYEFEQEMLKHVQDLKNNLKEEGWREKNSPEVSQISFLRNELKRKRTSGEGRPKDTQPVTHIEVYTRIQNLSRRNHVPFNQMVNHLLSQRLGVTMI